MPEHQSVGSSTLLMTPIFSIRSSLALTLGGNGRGTGGEVLSECGTAPGFSLMMYSCWMRPRPPHRFGYVSFSVATLILSSLATRPSAKLPGSAVCRSRTLSPASVSLYFPTGFLCTPKHVGGGEGAGPIHYQLTLAAAALAI